MPACLDFILLFLESRIVARDAFAIDHGVVKIASGVLKVRMWLRLQDNSPIVVLLGDSKALALACGIETVPTIPLSQRRTIDGFV